MIDLRSSSACGWLVLMSCWLGGCHESTPAGSEAARPSVPALTVPQRDVGAAELGPHRSPVRVVLSGPDQVNPGEDIELLAEVEQSVGPAAQVSLSLQLPPGVRLVFGQSGELLPSGHGKLVRRFVVHVDQLPNADIEAVATTQSTSFGARAQSAYRFGRPEPHFAQPLRRQQPLRVGGKSVGRPIQLRP